MDWAVTTHERLTLWEKLRLWTGCGLCIGLFWPLGRLILARADPMAALTLAGRADLFTSWLSVSALMAVAGGVGAVTLGGRRTYSGLLTAAVGLAALNLRFGTVQQFLAAVGVDPVARRSVFAGLIGETILWSAAMSVALVTESLVVRWLGLGRTPPLPEVSQAKSARSAGQTPGWAVGLLATGIAAVVAVVVLSQTLARTDVAWVARKQVYFALGLSFFLASLAASQVLPHVAGFWHLLAPTVVSLPTSSWAWREPVTRIQYYEAIPELPRNWLVRALPVEYLSMGVIGSILGVWIGGRLAATRRAGAAA